MELAVIETTPESILVHYEMKLEELTKTAEEFGAIAINGINDKKGYRAADEARKELKKLRVAIDKRRRELGEGAMKYKRTVDDVAKLLTAPVATAEDTLKGRIEAIDSEVQRIKDAVIQSRSEKLAAVEYRLPVSSFADLSDDQFTALLAEQTQVHEARLAEAEAEKKRLEEEAEARRIEAEQLAEEREELEAMKREIEEAKQKAREEQEAAEAEQQARLDAARAEIEAEKARIEAERQAAADAARREREIAEAAEAARVAEQKRIADEAAAAERKRQEHEAHEARQKELRPDREKLMEIVTKIATANHGITVSQGAMAAFEKIDIVLRNAASDVRNIINEMK